MYSVFRKHRVLKIILIVFGLVLISYLMKPASLLIGGRGIDGSSLIGSYAADREHQVVIYPEAIGRMVSSEHAEDFEFSYSEGTLYCIGEMSEWTMKALGDGNLWNGYDNSYQYKRS